MGYTSTTVGTQGLYVLTSVSPAVPTPVPWGCVKPTATEDSREVDCAKANNPIQRA